MRPVKDYGTTGRSRLARRLNEIWRAIECAFPCGHLLDMCSCTEQDTSKFTTPVSGPVRGCCRVQSS
jgi:hypothetical protein